LSDASRASGQRAGQGRVGTVVNGKWQIDARLGSGGMATVYAATHRNGHRAALKMLHTQLSRDKDTRARFLREAYVGNAVGHPAIVRVEDDGVAEDGSAFLVLELLDGETIEARRVRLGGMLPVGEALAIADKALDALGAAHGKGIVHRDVKPDNVFLTKDGQVKLLDFGLARMKDLRTEATKTGVFIGTPEFMSPEQAQGKRDEVDARSDVWGMGATLFTCITGKNVHDARNVHEQLVASATVRPRSVRALMPTLPEPVAIVIDRALELEKADRWESAQEMQRALRAARGGGAPELYVSDSLTLPAASPASMRRNEREQGAPQSGPRPSGPGVSLPEPSSDKTLKDALPGTPTSDRTIEDDPPVVLPGVPSTAPTTERITGSPGRPSSSPPAAPAPAGPREEVVYITAPLEHRRRASAPPRENATLQSPQVPQGLLDPAAKTGAPSPGPAASDRGSVEPSARSGPEDPGPVSLQQRRSARIVVIACVLLILACAGFGTFVLLGR